jgi:hypothetical protein
VSVDNVYAVLPAELRNRQECEGIVLVIRQADERGFDWHRFGICPQRADKSFDAFAAKPFNYAFDNDRRPTITEMVYYM